VVPLAIYAGGLCINACALSLPASAELREKQEHQQRKLEFGA
jgi:hypothetical protein